MNALLLQCLGTMWEGEGRIEDILEEICCILAMSFQQCFSPVLYEIRSKGGEKVEERRVIFDSGKIGFGWVGSGNVIFAPLLVGRWGLHLANVGAKSCWWGVGSGTMGEGHRTIFSKQMYYSDYNFKKWKLMLFFHKSLFPPSSCQRNI